jgi:hypothetical protein
MTIILEARKVKKSYYMGRVLISALRWANFDAEKVEFLSIYARAIRPVEALRYK